MKKKTIRETNYYRTRLGQKCFKFFLFIVYIVRTCKITQIEHNDRTHSSRSHLLFKKKNKNENISLEKRILKVKDING